MRTHTFTGFPVTTVDVATFQEEGERLDQAMDVLRKEVAQLRADVALLRAARPPAAEAKARS